MQEVFEKIIEQLEEYKSNVPVNRVIDDILKDKPKELGQLMAYDKAIEIVKQEAEKIGTDTNVGNGWIPCSERLPEEHITKDGHVDPSEEVLVYIYYGENCVSNGCGVSRYWEHTKFHKNPWIDLECGKENVIAWQPLPQPYQPKGE